MLAQQVGLRGKCHRRGREFHRFGWRPRSARILADNPWLMIWADRSSSAAASWLTAISWVASSYRFRLAPRWLWPVALRWWPGAPFSPIWLRDSYSRRRYLSAVAGSPASIAMRAAGWVTAAVMVGPRESRKDLARLRVACAAATCPASRTGPPCAGGSQPVRAGGSRSRRGSPHSAVFPLVPVSDPTAQPRRASRVSRPIASVVRLARIFGGAGQASSAAADRAWFQCSAASSCRVRQIPVRPGFGQTARNSGSARAISTAASFGSISVQQQGLNPGVGMLPFVAWRRRCAGRRRAWSLPSRAARPRSVPCRGCIKPRESRVVTRQQRSRAIKQIHCRDTSPRSCAALPAVSRCPAARCDSAADSGSRAEFGPIADGLSRW